MFHDELRRKWTYAFLKVSSGFDPRKIPKSSSAISGCSSRPQTRVSNIILTDDQCGLFDLQLPLNFLLFVLVSCCCSSGHCSLTIPAKVSWSEEKVFGNFLQNDRHRQTEKVSVCAWAAFLHFLHQAEGRRRTVGIKGFRLLAWPW